MSEPQPPTKDQLDAYIRTRLVLAGFDLALLSELPDPDSGAPTRSQVLASLRSFVDSTPGAMSQWSPAGQKPEYAQQASAPLLYPSIMEAWTETAGE
ncbi:hypothetical protein [Streptomyces sp. NBC_00299]|uniref:hypothetical protein n=1 Tax=Streptomyces sp. NBC_00299 TaxID=2975705 RepID=UPI002E287274|nr:hypothetical protein [Streptomyces sp. NBC_00299]